MMVVKERLAGLVTRYLFPKITDFRDLRQLTVQTYLIGVVNTVTGGMCAYALWAIIAPYLSAPWSVVARTMAVFFMLAGPVMLLFQAGVAVRFWWRKKLIEKRSQARLDEIDAEYEWALRVLGLKREGGDEGESRDKKGTKS